MLISDTPPASTQEAYDRIHAYFSRPDAVLAKLLKPEDEREPDSQFVCCYRTESGDGCAVGCLIPEGLYDPIIENESAHTLFSSVDTLYKHPEATTSNAREEDEDGYVDFDLTPLRDFFSEVDDDFLGQAQSLHDDESTKTPAEFLDKLNGLAQEHGLTVPA